jgi:pyrroline-5-carboxylate reductase
MVNHTLCILGCGTLYSYLRQLTLIRYEGNLGTPILKSLIYAPSDSPAAFTKFIACVNSEASEKRLSDLFTVDTQSGKLVITRGDNVKACHDANVVILGVDPSQVSATLSETGITRALKAKLLISVVAGLSRPYLEELIGANSFHRPEGRIWILRTLPNVCAQVSQSLTAIEDPAPDFPEKYMSIADAIFNQIGKTIHIAPRLMAATTAVGGSTPAFWAIICDSLIDAAVAVGLPRPIAQAQIYQSMLGSATMLQSGIQPGELRDMGTSPEGCTIGGVMVMEEMGVRGALGKALRESVTIARAMGGESGKEGHVNDTRQGQ